MLYAIDDLDHPITHLPHQKEFDAWRAGLTDQQYADIVAELSSRVEGGEVHTSSWLPGSNWEGTVFQPIYESACRQNFDASARFFGLIVWKMFMDREEDWSFGRYEKDGMPISGITYFRIDRRP